MRNYIILDTSRSRASKIQKVLEALAEFRCVAILHSLEEIPNIIPYNPELVLLDLDDPRSKFIHSVARLNHTLGVIPKYIGYTVSTERGFEAYKAGFVEVVLAPNILDKIVTAFNAYRYNFQINTLYCIDWYHDYVYIDLKNVVLLKADNYTSNFFLQDGSCIRNFKSLKNTHHYLPSNFQRIHRSWVVNSHYVCRINMHKHRLHLKHYAEPLPYTDKYIDSIVEIKKMLTKLTIYSFLLFPSHGLIALLTCLEGVFTG